MKKIIFTLILLSSLLFATVIEKVYNFGDFTIKNMEEFQIIEFENTQQNAEIGNPVLPYCAVSLLLPPGEIAESIEIIGFDETEIEGVFNLYPKQSVRPISEGNSEKFRQNEIYSSSQVYPQKLNGQLITQFLNGHSFAFSTITPIQYIPTEKKVSYFQKIKVKIVTKPAEKAMKALRNLRNIKEIEKLSQNSEMLLEYPQIQSRDGEYQLLIITSNQFQEEFNELQNMYLQHGIMSEISTTEEIESSIDGDDLAEKIRNYIIQEYQENDIEFVLLGGDVEIIPARGFYCTVDSGSGYESTNIPSDLYYSALDGSWNDDDDNLWGEIGEDDLLPEIAVARLPFSNSTDLNNLINKSISYQTNPVLNELNKPLLAGEHLYDDPLTWGADYMDLLVGHHEDNGYTTDGISENDNIETLYDRDLGYWTAEELIAEINNGHSFIHHCGHASYFYNMRMSSSYITNENFYSLNGVDHNFTLVYTHGCNSGGFDENDCIAEQMVTIENFAAAFVGNSRYGWFNEGFTEGPSQHLHREFVDALYGNKNNEIGKTHLESKIDTSPWVTAPGQWEEGALRWCFYDCNVLGDPAMKIWTDEPISAQIICENEIAVGSSSVLVEIETFGNSAEGIVCTILKNDILCGTALTNESGVAEIIFEEPILEEGIAELFISGYNILPTSHEINFVQTNIYGDVNGDGEVLAHDASLTLQNTVNLLDFEEWQLILADVDGNGEIQAFDASLILQFAVGIIDEFPIEGE